MEIGFALLKNNKVVKMEKGLHLDVRDIALTVKNLDYDWCLFHTRLATVGSKNDNNCHPFIRKDTVLAMNGSEPSVGFISKPLDTTDTEMILDIISKYNLSINVLKNFTSIFMGFNNGIPFVVANNTQRIKLLKSKTSKAIVFASNFPAIFKEDIYIPKEKFIWKGEKIPNVFKKYIRKPKKTAVLEDYIYHNDLYGQCFMDIRSDKGGNSYGM